jgi:hypothetical protein
MTDPNLDKLVRDILLDVALLKWFAAHRRPQAAIMAIELAQEQASSDEHAVLGFLATHISAAT